MTSFNLTWDKTPKVSGKVFAKRALKKDTVTTSSPKTSSLEEPKPLKIISKSNEKNGKTRKIEQQNTEHSSEYIKRKRNKDKLKNTTDEIRSNNTQENLIEGNRNNNNNNNTIRSLFSVKRKDVYINANIPGKPIVEKVFSGGKFCELDIHKHLVSNLEKHSFGTLTTVQQKSIPVILKGNNVLIRSQTGSGKTLAYAVPIINSLQNVNPRLQRKDGVQVMVIVPTRELALQTHELFNKINTFQWVIVGHLCGGENRQTEKARLRKGVHVLIGTPGRLLDHILHTNAFKINKVRCLVLDEADRLLDMGFKKDIFRIVEELGNARKYAEYDPISLLKGNSIKVEENLSSSEHPPLNDTNSEQCQTLLLSATLNTGVADLADFAMKEHVFIDALDDSFKMNPEHLIIPKTVQQEFMVTHIKHKLFILAAILIAKQNHKLFVFMGTGQMVDYHYELFTQCLLKMPKNRGKFKHSDLVLLEDADLMDIIEEDDVVLDTQFFKLHGSMEQSMRKKVFSEFKASKRGVLFCTDVAARGVDIPEADYIIQYTAAQSDEDYLHRVGRTGRAGKSGTALIFLTHEEQEYITRLQKHKLFLKQQDPNDFLRHLCAVMDEPDKEKAATVLQNRFENAVEKNKNLHKIACFAYSSWSRFYNTYPSTMQEFFNFKNVNLGHCVTSFALRETPSSIAKIVRGEVANIQPRKLNQKLTIHENEDVKPKSTFKRKAKSICLSTSEFSSGLEPTKKKKKKNNI